MIEAVCEAHQEHWVGTVSDNDSGAVTVAPAILAKYVAVYRGLWGTVLRTVRVTLEDDSLYVNGLVGEPVRLIPHSDTFFMSTDGLTYTFGGDGTAISYVVERHVSGDWRSSVCPREPNTMRLYHVLGRTAAARLPVSVAARGTLWIAAVASSFALTLAVNAHHSYSEYDDTKSVEVEGKLVDVAWQNPHARILVQVTDSAGKTVTWDVESAGLNNFRRMNVPLEIFKVGDTVKVAGWPSKRSGVRMYGTNLLAGDGQELRDVALLEAALGGDGARLRLGPRVVRVRNRIRVGHAVSHVGLRPRRSRRESRVAVRGLDLAVDGEGAAPRPGSTPSRTRPRSAARRRACRPSFASRFRSSSSIAATRSR